MSEIIDAQFTVIETPPDHDANQKRIAKKIKRLTDAMNELNEAMIVIANQSATSVEEAYQQNLMVARITITMDTVSQLIGIYNLSLGDAAILVPSPTLIVPGR